MYVRMYVGCVGLHRDIWGHEVEGLPALDLHDNSKLKRGRLLQAAFQTAGLKFRVWGFGFGV